MHAEAIGDTQSEVETKHLLDTLPYILTYVKAAAVVNTVVVTLA